MRYANHVLPCDYQFSKKLFMGKTPLGAKRKATLSFLLGGMTQMSTVYRGVVPGVAGGTMADQTYLNREGQIIPTILLLAPPDFQTILWPCKE